jgi:hypothetical protein
MRAALTRYGCGQADSGRAEQPWLSQVDNHIRSYENVITYMNVGTCRYQCTTIHKYPVPELDALWKLKDGTFEKHPVPNRTNADDATMGR